MRGLFGQILGREQPVNDFKCQFTAYAYNPNGAHTRRRSQCNNRIIPTGKLSLHISTVLSKVVKGAKYNKGSQGGYTVAGEYPTPTALLLNRNLNALLFL